jgi:hypothetical protein
MVDVEVFLAISRTSVVVFPDIVPTAVFKGSVVVEVFDTLHSSVGTDVGLPDEGRPGGGTAFIPGARPSAACNGFPGPDNNEIAQSRTKIALTGFNLTPPFPFGSPIDPFLSLGRRRSPHCSLRRQPAWPP